VAASTFEFAVSQTSGWSRFRHCALGLLVHCLDVRWHPATRSGSHRSVVLAGALRETH